MDQQTPYRSPLDNYNDPSQIKKRAKMSDLSHYGTVGCPDPADVAKDLEFKRWKRRQDARPFRIDVGGVYGSARMFMDDGSVWDLIGGEIFGASDNARWELVCEGPKR